MIFLVNVKSTYFTVGLKTTYLLDRKIQKLANSNTTQGRPEKTKTKYKRLPFVVYEIIIIAMKAKNCPMTSIKAAKAGL